MKTIGYVLGDFPVLSETFVGNEVRAVAQRGHAVVPIVMHRGIAPAQPEDELVARRAIHLDSLPRFQVVFGRNPGARRSGLRSALSFAFRQKGLRRHSLMLNGM